MLPCKAGYTRGRPKMTRRDGPHWYGVPPVWKIGLAVLLGLMVAALVACGATGESKFVSVSAGSTHTCGVKTDGSVACRGNDEYGQSTPPEGEVRVGQCREPLQLRGED